MDEALKSGWLVAIAVAVLPSLLGIIGGFIGREARTPREIRNLTHLTESLSKVPVGTDAYQTVSELVSGYASSIRAGLVDRPKLNKANVALTFFLLFATLAAMYGLSNWITVSSASGWNVLAVVVTVLVGLFLFLLNIAAVSIWYKPPTDKDKAEATPSGNGELPRA